MTRYNTKPCRTCKTVTSAIAGRRLENVRHPVRGWVYAYDGGVLVDNGRAILACRGCGATVEGIAVRGAFRADKKCDARCESATGHNCECQCGGKNHGAGHSVAA